MEDRRGEWENNVNRNLVSLNSAIRQAQKLVDDLDLQCDAIDKVLRGDRENDTDGLIARQHASENLVNELRAELKAISNAVYGDHAGGKGHEQRINALEDKRDLREKRRDKREGYFWHYITAVTVQLLILAGILVLNWDRIEAFARAHLQHPAAASAPAKKNGKKQRPKKKKALPPVVLPEMEGHESSSEEMP